MQRFGIVALFNIDFNEHILRLTRQKKKTEAHIAGALLCEKTNKTATLVLVNKLMLYTIKLEMPAGVSMRPTAR